MNGGFHPNNNIDRFYIPQYQGQKGLKSVKSLVRCRIVSLYNHLQTYKNRNEYVHYVYQQEEIQSIRIGKELINKIMLSLHQLMHQNKQERNFYDEFKKKSQTHTDKKQYMDTSERQQN